MTTAENQDRSLVARQSQDFDLNLAPIIDCFVVLIAFVMISTAFASIGILDAGIVAGGHTASAKTEPEVRLRVDLNREGAIQMRMSGKDSRTFTVPPDSAGNPDVLSMEKRLGEIKAQWPSLTQVRLAAANDVAYQEVVTSIETIRRTVPGVALDGF